MESISFVKNESESEGESESESCDLIFRIHEMVMMMNKVNDDGDLSVMMIMMIWIC